MSQLLLFLLLLLLLSDQSFCLPHLNRPRRGVDAECTAPTGTYDSIIVGSGIAGFAAAVELYMTLGIKNITLLEARSRIGGRIYTVRHNGDKFEEMGAEWVHGNRSHDFMTFISKNNIFVPENEKPSGDVEWYSLNGTEISDAIVDSVADAYVTIYNSVDPKSNVSVGDQIKTTTVKWLRNNSENADAKQAVFRTFYGDECTDVGDDLSQVSTIEDAKYVDVPGNLQSLVKNGLYSIFEKMTIGLPIDSFIKFGAKVKRIRYDISCSWSNKKLVAVYLADGRFFLARTAIVTFPLGVLKAGSVEFIPALSSAKQTAITRLGNGCINKVFLYYRKPWWGSSSALVPVFLNSIKDYGVSITPSFYAGSNETKWYQNIVGFSVPYGGSNVLEAWLYGDSAKIAEKLPIDEVSRIVTQIVKNAFGTDFSVTDPYLTDKTSWCNDEFSMGGSPYTAMGSYASDFKTLADPLPDSTNPNLFFAGDATSLINWGSVHGAWSTGIRAADEAAVALIS